ncbi:putative RNA methyltransferase [Escherichia coli]|uniref:Putative RNA methyltransferase n=1 Tax=Escherichia coli TaxID=562 RepID=A0A377BV26_ECOLX|nr:putative RNA methyltransferase [Escherichia coli]
MSRLRANPEYSSLNLAMAVQVIAYEVRMAWLATQENGEQVEHEERRIRWSMIWSVFMVIWNNAAGTGFIRKTIRGR